MSSQNLSNYKSWADLSDSDDSDVFIKPEYISSNKKESNIKKDTKSNNINLLINDFETTINNSKNDYLKNKIYSLVNARMKNSSHVGLNKLDKDTNEWTKIKLEFYYTKRRLKIYKLYNNISLDLFREKFNTIKNTFINTIEDMKNNVETNIFQNCFICENILYIPFFKVDNKFFDIIKYYSNEKQYEIIFYPIEL